MDSLLQSETAYVIDWPEVEDVDFDTLSDALLEHKAHDGDSGTDGYVSESEYDALNRVTKITLPKDVEDERKEITPNYNRSGSLESVEFDGTTYVEHISYNAKGQRLLAAFGNGVMARYTYDNETFRLKRQRTETYSQTGYTFTSGGSVKQDTAYFYDLVGNVIQTKENRTDSGFGLTLSGAGGATPDELIRRFEYDPIYRLLKATGREGTEQSESNIWSDVPSQSPTPGNTREYKRRYEYDKVGNITKLSHHAYTNSFTRNFIYSNISQKNSLTRVENGSSSLLVDFDYDVNGNTIQANTERFYEWNHSDELKFFKIDDGMTVSVYGQYRYSGGGRVKKLVKDQDGNYTTTVYIDGVFEYQKLVKGMSTYERNYIHVMDDKSRIGTVRVGSDEDDITDNEYYIIEDTLSSVTARLAADGSVIDREEYYPFGETSLRNFAAKRYRYTGKEKDSESGLYYYGARYYAAWTCKFLSTDAMADSSPGISPYAYANDNPINYNDPTGNQTNEETKPSGGDGAGNIDYLKYDNPMEMVTTQQDETNLQKPMDPGRIIPEGEKEYEKYEPKKIDESDITLQLGSKDVQHGLSLPSEFPDYIYNFSPEVRRNLRQARWKEGEPLPSVHKIEYVPVEAVLLPASLPFKTGSRLVNVGLEVANPISGMRSVGGASKNVTKNAVEKIDNFAAKGVEEVAQSTTGRLQAYVTQAAKEVDALGDAAFTPKQLLAIQRHPYLRDMYRGNRIDVRARQLIKNDPGLSFLKSNYRKGPDFVDPKTGDWWDMTTSGSWNSHVNKYGSGGTLLRTK